MKKILIVLIVILLLGSIMSVIFLSKWKASQKEVQIANMEFEQYKDRELYGTDVATIINKAIDNNTYYHIEKDKNENYIEDGQYSIKVEVKIQENTYQMEAINRLGTIRFVQNFNLLKFKCSRNGIS